MSKPKTISIRVIRAAVEQHNNKVRVMSARLEAQAQEKALKTIEASLGEAKRLLDQVTEIRRHLKTLGWDTDISTTYQRLEVSFTASLTAKRLEREVRAIGQKVPASMSENEVILALAATGESDVSAALSKIGLLWKD